MFIWTAGVRARRKNSLRKPRSARNGWPRNGKCASNAYVPLSGKKQMGTSGGEALSDPYLAGSGIYVDVAGQNAVVEKPLWGADAEAGLKLPGKDFWVHAGAFAFDASEAEAVSWRKITRDL
jgi:hypothetical protein